MSASEPRGSIYVEVTISGRWAISYLTDGWSDQEKQCLLDGDPEAVNALEEAALRATCDRPDDIESEHYRIDWSKQVTA